MRDPAGDQNRATPEVTRVKGGVSARVGAIAVAGVLGAVVWIGLSGRSTPPRPAGPPLAVGLEETRTIEPSAQPSETPTGPKAAPTYDPGDIFGVLATLGNSQFITILGEPEPGHLTGRLRVPVPPPATRGTFSFQQFSAPSARGRPVPVGKWLLRLESLSAASGREYVVLDESIKARRQLLHAPRPVLRGFRVTVSAQSGVDPGELTIDIWIGANQRLVVEDDGIFSWPLKSNYAPPNVAPEAITRRTRFSNVCRWDAPRPESSSIPADEVADEANC